MKLLKTKKGNKERKILERLAVLSDEEKMLGESSTQVFFQLKKGKILNFGITNDDVTETKGLWVRILDGKHYQPLYKSKQRCEKEYDDQGENLDDGSPGYNSTN